MLDVQKKLHAACSQHGKAWGRPVGSAEDVKTLVALGAKFIAYGSEFGAIHAHLAACGADFDKVL
jgi:2-keto-3-deoxy-L-rhamnonate aldolase RhmA